MPSGELSQAALIQALSSQQPTGDLLRALHRLAIDAVGGRSSILFQFDAAGREGRATSGEGIGPLPNETLVPPGSLLSMLVPGGMPVFVSNLRQTVPSVASALETNSAAIAAVSGLGAHFSWIAVGCDDPPGVRALQDLATIVLAFGIAIDRGRAERWMVVHQHLRPILQGFSAAAAPTFDLDGGLQVLCSGVNSIFDADRSSIWVHDRTARKMMLGASTDGDAHNDATMGPRNRRTIAAAALRRDLPDIADFDSHVKVLSIPLKGQRRALGAILIEKAFPQTDAADVLEQAGEVGRQVSSAVEHVLLFSDVLQARGKLADAEKLSALGQFVAGIAHELNNPLQSVLGHLELLRTMGAFPKPIRPDMQRIYREADRAAQIVRTLLVFSGSRGSQHRRVSINLVLTRVLALRAESFRARGIVCVREFDRRLPRVKGDPPLLQQALLNVVQNAEQAIGNDGRIVVRTTFASEAGAVQIDIYDSGPGIPDSVRARIFEPFFTTKDVGQGTGLGLAMVHGIIQEHGGQISASNAAEGGALFSIQLPADLERLG